MMIGSELGDDLNCNYFFQVSGHDSKLQSANNCKKIPSVSKMYSIEMVSLDYFLNSRNIENRKLKIVQNKKNLSNKNSYCFDIPSKPKVSPHKVFLIEPIIIFFLNSSKNSLNTFYRTILAIDRLRWDGAQLLGFTILMLYGINKYWLGILGVDLAR